jgi:uncharacterized protein (TIGR03118 family)
LNSNISHKNGRGCVAKVLASLAFLMWIPLVVRAAPPGYVQTNLVSNIPGLALTTDPRMLNPWGVAWFPGASPFWINENRAGVSSLYFGTGEPVSSLPFVTIPAPTNIPGGTPTGIVANTFSAFNIGELGPALFIFDTEDGTIEAWNPSVSPLTSAVIVVDNSDGGRPTGAVYKGLALASVGTQPYLYATNFRSGKIDVFDGSFNPVTLSGSFTDPKMERGYAPFGIQTINGNLWVTYTVQDQAKHNPVNRPNHGIVDVFDTSGNFVRRFVGHNRLNSPWAVVLTPLSFTPLAGKVLIGNFGDGRIPAYDPVTGDAIGYLRDTNGKMISIPALWTLTFSDALGTTPGALYFTAGLSHQMNGLFGTFTPEGTPN